jgi:hypothetical protein
MCLRFRFDGSRPVARNRRFHLGRVRFMVSHCAMDPHWLPSLCHRAGTGTYRVENPCLAINFAGTRNAVMVYSRMEAKASWSKTSRWCSEIEVRPRNAWHPYRTVLELGGSAMIPQTPHPPVALVPPVYWLSVRRNQLSCANGLLLLRDSFADSKRPSLRVLVSKRL